MRGPLEFDVGDVVEDTVREVGRYIREQRNAAAMSVRHLAQQAGVSNPYLSQIERGLRHPSALILKDIARALRISAETLYVKAGLLDESRRDGVTGAILREPTLSERQKQVLLEVYESLRASGSSAPAATREPATAAEAPAASNGAGRRGTAKPRTAQPRKPAAARTAAPARRAPTTRKPAARKPAAATAPARPTAGRASNATRRRSARGTSAAARVKEAK